MNQAVSRNLTVLTNHPSPRRLLTGILVAWLVSLSVSSADEPAELASLRSRAGSGDVKAQLDLAHRYRDGKGVAKDEAAAMQWAHRAADAGNADAMDFVGHA